MYAMVVQMFIAYLFEFSTAIIQAFYKLSTYEWIVTRIPRKLSAVLSRDYLRTHFFKSYFSLSSFMICN